MKKFNGIGESIMKKFNAIAWYVILILLGAFYLIGAFFPEINVNLLRAAASICIGAMFAMCIFDIRNILDMD